MTKNNYDYTTTIRQQRRREVLKQRQVRLVQVVLTPEQGEHLDALLATDYAADKQSVMAKALDEAYERNNKQ